MAVPHVSIMTQLEWLLLWSLGIMMLVRGTRFAPVHTRAIGARKRIEQSTDEQK